VKGGLQEALLIAQNSRCKYKHGAVVMRRGKIISRGTNYRRFAPTDRSWRASYVHAEEMAIHMAGDVTGATIFVARVNNSGDPLPSQPCKRCSGLIERSGITIIYHT